MKKYILALDQGTTSSRCIIYDKKGNMISVAQKEFTQIYPAQGWVEHDANEIWQTQMTVAHEAMLKADLTYQNIEAIGVFPEQLHGKELAVDLGIHTPSAKLVPQKTLADITFIIPQSEPAFNKRNGSFWFWKVRNFGAALPAQVRFLFFEDFSAQNTLGREQQVPQMVQ